MLQALKLRTAPKRAAQRHKTEEGFLHFVVAVPQEREEKQRLATTPVGMTEFRDRPLTKSSRALALKSRRRILPGANPHP